MKFEIEVNWITWFAAGLSFLLALGFASLAFMGQPTITTQEVVCPSELSLSEADFNKLAELEYWGGSCERAGLVSSVIIQEDVSGQQYGVPICLAPEAANG